MNTRESSLGHLKHAPSLTEIVVAAQKVNWHYTQCCYELGYKRRVTQLRFIIEEAGYSWGTLACATDPLAVVKFSQPIRKLTIKTPDTVEELAALAKHFNWNQSAVCRHIGLKSMKAGFGFRKLRRWGYDHWTDFCVKNGKPRPPLSKKLLIQAGHDCKWSLGLMVIALQYKENGAIVSWIQRNGYISWSEFRRKHAPEKFHPMREQLTFESIAQAAKENRWRMKDMEASLGYIPGGGGVRKWLKRRGYTWKEYIAEQLDLPAIPKTDVNLIQEEIISIFKKETAEIAARNGWHIDLTAWELDIDRKSLLEKLSAQGFPNWQSFYEAQQ